MTTIAYRDGIIACDSLWTMFDAVDTHASKIMRLASGALLGMAGANDSRPYVTLLDKVKTLKQLPSYGDIAAIRQDFAGLLVLPSGRIVRIEGSLKAPEHMEDSGDIGAWEINRDFYAIGNGSDFAIGAMEMGASARQAVRVACRNSPMSRLPVHTLSLPQLVK